MMGLNYIAVKFVETGLVTYSAEEVPRPSVNVPREIALAPTIEFIAYAIPANLLQSNCQSSKDVRNADLHCSPSLQTLSKAYLLVRLGIPLPFSSKPTANHYHRYLLIQILLGTANG